MRAVVHGAVSIEVGGVDGADADGSGADAAGAPALADGIWWTFPALPVHARLARGWLTGWLGTLYPCKEERAYGATVAFSELVTNAVLHGAGPITVYARLDERRLLCEITDRSVELPRLLGAGPDNEHHRGLSLVAMLATSWSVRATAEGGKTIAFTVDLDEG